MAYTKYSLTPANNNSAPPDGAPEGMLPSAVNDTMRDMMAQIRDCGDGIRDGTYTMTAPKITGGTITGVTYTSIVITGGSITGITDLAVADGGTGASSFTSGALLKGAGSSAITTATAGTDYVAPSGALGTPSSGTLTNCTADGTNAVGYRNVPQSGSDKTTSYTLTTGDVGKFIGVGTSGSITIPNSTFAAGDIVSIFNNTSGGITITCTITTAYIAGTNTDVASVTLATRGVATLLFISGTVVTITGNVA
jgi:hypothetical protein